MPSCGMSRSRNVRTKLRLQSDDARVLRARNARGKPPRPHRVRQASVPVSFRPKPPRSTSPTRPARDSDTPFTSSGDALPSRRKRASLSGRSTSTRRVSKRAGIRWTSSMTTSPRSRPRICSGVARRCRSTAASRSNQVLPRESAAICRASVVLPHWRGPVSAAQGCTSRASWMCLAGVGRSISITHNIPCKSAVQVRIFKDCWSDVAYPAPGGLRSTPANRIALDSRSRIR